MTQKRPDFYLKSTDLDMVRWLVDFRFLQPRHFQKLTGRHIVSLRRRLRQLLTHGFVERMTLPLPRSRPVASPPDEYVYRLGRKGVALARDQIGADLAYNSEKRATFLQHDVMVTDFHLALSLATQQVGHLELRWQQQDLQDWAVGQNGERLSVNPDALFSLTDQTLPADRNTRFVFLEMERSRQHSYEAGESALARKFTSYDLYARQGRQQATWGIPDFRVVVVLPTPERVNNLLVKLEQSGLAFKRFWLTDVGSYSLDGPAIIASRIFRTPSDHGTGAVYSFVE